MKAYMELVNNMLLTAEVQQTLVTPRTYISDCRQESFRIFPHSGNTAVLRLGCQLLRWKETGKNSLTLWIACWHVPVAMCDSPHLSEVCHTAVEVTDQKMPVVPGVLPHPLAGQAPRCHCPHVHAVRDGRRDPLLHVYGRFRWRSPSTGAVLEALERCRWLRNWGLVTCALSWVWCGQQQQAFGLSIVLVLVK